MDTMPKIKNFLWYLLPVRSILIKRGLDINPSCPFFLDDVELTDHLFEKYQMVKKKVWKLVEKHGWIPSYAFSSGSQHICQCLNTINHLTNPKMFQKIFLSL